MLLLVTPLLVLLVSLSPPASGLKLPPAAPSSTASPRRAFLGTAAAAASFALAPPSSFAVSMDELRALPIEGDKTGGATRLANLQAMQASQINLDPETVEVSPGVTYQDYKAGSGADKVKDGSRVALEMTVRCSTLTSTNEPNGVMIYSTAKDDDFGELFFRVGSGRMSPAVEGGIAGMSKGGIRRVFLTSERAYEWKNSGLLPEPKADSMKKAVERVFKNKADLVVEVKVLRVKP